jgi:hypothetical protein
MMAVINTRIAVTSVTRRKAMRFIGIEVGYCRK